MNHGQCLETPLISIIATEFKSRCLALMDEVARRGTVVVVTKRGRPIAELRPMKGQRAKSIIGLHRGRIQIRGDILAPVDARWKTLE
jgi:prevent-host-death family protein